MDAGAIEGPEVISAKEAKVREVLAAMKKTGKKGFVTLHILMDAKEVMQVLKGDYNWSINLIILDIKALALVRCIGLLFY